MTKNDIQKCHKIKVKTSNNSKSQNYSQKMAIRDILTPFTSWKKVFREPVTVKDPLNDRPGAERYRGFHKNDLEKCIGCGSCEEICENEAIDPCSR
jgi:formate hydrogenlyase subunit 6/NADH:ubiquinone oxidoreductase subunit I